MAGKDFKIYENSLISCAEKFQRPFPRSKFARNLQSQIHGHPGVPTIDVQILRSLHKHCIKGWRHTMGIYAVICIFAEACVRNCVLLFDEKAGPVFLELHNTMHSLVG